MIVVVRDRIYTCILLLLLLPAIAAFDIASFPLSLSLCLKEMGLIRLR